MGRHTRRFGLITAAVIAGFALMACSDGDGGADADADSPEATTAAEASTTEATTTAAADGAASDGQVKGMPPGDFFAANCAACHGQHREGGIGLPLTPDKLTKEDAFYQDTIRNGRSGTAMQPMGTILGLSDEEIATLVTFFKTDQP